MTTIFRQAIEGEAGNYATAAELSGLAPNATPTQLANALFMATLLIDSLVPEGFGAATTGPKVFDDVRNRMVVLPKPFSDITDVTIDYWALGTGMYELFDWGIRLFPSYSRDGSGFPIVGAMDLPALNAYGFDDTGYTVTVTATWGYASIPPAVTRACLLLALDQLSSDGSTSVDSSRVASFSVEGYSVTYRDQTTSVGSSTGNVMADRLLSPWLPNKAGCA